MRIFRDRREAGRQLGEALARTPGLAGAVVYGVARGGVIVADEVASVLGGPLEVLVVRKIGLPREPELAMGAIGEGGVVVTEDAVTRRASISSAAFEEARASETAELERRVQRYRRGASLERRDGATAVIVDDGAATGATMRAACRVVRSLGVGRVVLAVPVMSTEAARALRVEAGELATIVQVSGSFSVGQWFTHFDQVLDDEVTDCLEAAARRRQLPLAANVAASPEES